MQDGDAVTAVDLIADGKISFVVNTPQGRGGRSDGEQIRKAASLHRVSCVTTIEAALAAAQGLAERPGDALAVRSLQEYHASMERRLTCRSLGSVRPGPMNAIDTRVRVGSVELRNPVMTASGTAGYGDELASFFDLAAIGAMVVKSLAAFEWAGNPAPRLHPTPQGMLNAVGLQGPGIPHWLAHDLPDLAGDRGATVVASIWGRIVDEYRARRRTARRRARTAWSPSRSTCRVPTSRAAVGSSPTTPRLSAAVIAATTAVAGRAGRSSARTPTASSRSPRPCATAGAEAVTLRQHDARDGRRPATRAGRARRRRRRAVGAGDPPDRGPRGARRARGPARPADRRRRWCGEWVGRGRADARRGLPRSRSEPPSFARSRRRPPTCIDELVQVGGRSRASAGMAEIGALA